MNEIKDTTFKTAVDMINNFHGYGGFHYDLNTTTEEVKSVVVGNPEMESNFEFEELDENIRDLLTDFICQKRIGMFMPWEDEGSQQTFTNKMSQWEEIA